jgi:hypothetical protein
VALRSYGVAIEQIRLERIALPEENVTAVFDQMRAERRQFAAKYQAEGEQAASKIRSEAELEAARITAKGSRRDGAHPRRVGGTGREDLCRCSPHRPGALPLYALAGFSGQARHRQHVAHSSYRLRALFSACKARIKSEKARATFRDRRLAAPVARLIDGAWQRVHWWVVTMVVLYCLSGITIVKSDEVAVDPALGTVGGSHACLAGAWSGPAFCVSAARGSESCAYRSNMYGKFR